MIRVEDIHISADGKEIIKGVTFNIVQGEYLSLIGPNGAGKSTILKSLCRIVPFSSGSINILGKNILDYSQKDLASKITYIGQLPPNDFTVREFIFFSRYPYLSPFSGISKEDRSMIEESMAATSTLEFASRKLSELSSGERQRVAIASALAQDTDIILFDEPVTHLDPFYDSQISELIYNVKKSRNITVINATHNLNNALKYSDRILAVKSGRIEFLKKADETGSEDMSRLFGIGFVSMENPSDRKKVMIRL